MSLFLWYVKGMDKPTSNPSPKNNGKNKSRTLKMVSVLSEIEMVFANLWKQKHTHAHAYVMAEIEMQINSLRNGVPAGRKMK